MTTRIERHDTFALDEALRGYVPPNFRASSISLLRRLRDPDADTMEIAEGVNANPALMVRLLQMVNSAAFGLDGKVTDARHAVCVLGRGRLESLVLGLTVREALPREPAACFDDTRFWRGSLRRGALARSLAEQLHPAQAMECFTIGVLQDMAVPVLAAARGDDYAPVLREWFSDSQQVPDLSVMENDAIGLTHGSVGRLLGEHWGIPEGILHPIENHHDDSSEVLAAVRLVSFVREGERYPDVERIVEAARQDHDLEPDHVVATVENAFQQADELARQLR
ncbi:MAG: HDOD domain-containing protein [Planctomycetota bacterium]